MAVQATLGPALVAFLVVGHDSLGWLVLAALFLAGTAAIGPSADRVRRNLPAERPEPTAHPEPAPQPRTTA